MNKPNPFIIVDRKEMESIRKSALLRWEELAMNLNPERGEWLETASAVLTALETGGDVFKLVAHPRDDPKGIAALDTMFGADTVVMPCSPNPEVCHVRLAMASVFR
jgi:hypothetical protein